MNKMKFIYIQLVVFVLLMLSSCTKYVVDISPEYEGEWHSDHVTGNDGIDVEMYFIIEGEHGVLGEWCELAPLGQNCFRTFSGDVKFNISKKKFYIGSLKNRAVLEIDVPPHINSDGVWECTLTERVYKKI